MIFLFASLFWSLVSWGAVHEPLGQAAEYYFQHHDYRQALSLWTETLKRRPDHLHAALRVSELTLLFEGRQAAREILSKFLTTNQSALTHDARMTIREKWAALQVAFVSDEGQSVFLQALPKIRHKDCAGAVPLLGQALGFEKGNLRVLREKARCEKSLGQLDRYYETLKLANDSDPFAPDVVESLMEAHIYHAQLDKVSAVAQPLKEEPGRTLRYRVALAYSLAETGGGDLALSLLQSMVEQERNVSIHPIVYLTIGKILSKRVGSTTEALGYLERFLSLMEVTGSTNVDGWDPYRSQDKLEDAKKMLAQLKR